MKKLFVGLFVTAILPLAQAAQPFTLPDGENPAEILQEMQQENPALYEKALEAEQFNQMDSLNGSQSEARVYVLINKASRAQTMQVYVDGQLAYNWRVSTGREQRENPPSGRRYFSGTPVGAWTPYGLTRLHRSRTWNADMPYAIWLTGGIAIHAAAPSYESRLGSRASGGCIRLSYRNASTLYSLVQQYGRGNTYVRIVSQ